jgi:HPt (histidine-containing phosphotransfer) domain-containing protein
MSRTLAEAFLALGQAQIDAMKSAGEDDAGEVVRRAARALHESAVKLKATELRDLCARLEREASTADPIAVASLIGDVETEFFKLEMVLKAELKEEVERPRE